LLAVHPVTAAAATTVVAATKPKPENKLRDKVAALVANAQGQLDIVPGQLSAGGSELVRNK